MNENKTYPWSVFDGYNENDPHYTVEGNGVTLAHIRSGTQNPNPKATATLMAAAPELLEALINLLKACNNADVHGELSEFIDGSLLGDAEEAIAKAKGEQA